MASDALFQLGIASASLNISLTEGRARQRSVHLSERRRISTRPQKSFLAGPHHHCAA